MGRGKNEEGAMGSEQVRTNGNPGPAIKVRGIQSSINGLIKKMTGDGIDDSAKPPLHVLVSRVDENG